jgi:hypothetical protein
MRIARLHLIAAGVALLLVAAAGPPSNPRAEDYYDRGGYLAAAKAGEDDGSAAGLSIAARATLADATLRDMACLDCLKRAENYARRAIMTDAKYSEGHVELAASLGFQARLVGSLRARLRRYPEQAKEAIDAALKLTPNDPWALSAAGGWNIEVVRIGGSFLGGIFYGASVDDGIALYRKAIAADPGNLVISFNYALSLTGYDFEDKRLEIMAVLDAIARGEPRDAYAAAMKARAVKLLDLLNHDKRDEYQALAHRYLGYP